MDHLNGFSEAAFGIGDDDEVWELILRELGGFLVFQRHNHDSRLAARELRVLGFELT